MNDKFRKKLSEKENQQPWVLDHANQVHYCIFNSIKSTVLACDAYFRIKP